MLETNALGLDYCTSIPAVQLIQSQTVHGEHMHNGATVRLRHVSLRVLP